MSRYPVWRLFLMIFIVSTWGCATVPDTVNPYFEMPPDNLPKAERELFFLALQQQKSNKLDSSMELWKRFLENNSRSFRGYNNLGMAYYTNDQLSSAISSFETALALETFDPKIKENLKRTLRFQVTLLRENKDFDAAITHLKRVGELSNEGEREKIALEIETLEDRIFEQVKRSNTLEDYEVFLARYPNSPKNSDEARRQIARMKPEASPMGEIPAMADAGMGTTSQMPPKSFVPESMETPKSSLPTPVISDETIEIVAEEKRGSEAEEMQKAMEDEFPKEEPMMEPDPVVEKMTEKKIETKPAMKKQPKQVKEAAAKPVKKVKVITKNTPLRVRADPSSKSRVIAQIPVGTIVPMLQETGQWYQIEYSRGQKGWISKKYSQLIK